MAQIINMPKLSDTMTVGTLVKWLKPEGAGIKTGDILAEVETDKATMELESFFDGTLLKQFVAIGAQVPIGGPLCAIGEPGEKVDMPKVEGGIRKADTENRKPEIQIGQAEIKNPVPPPVSNPVSAASSPVSGIPNPVSAAGAPVSEGSPVSRVRISPLARKLAAAKGVDYSRLQGTGPGGRIVQADILAAAAKPAPAPSAPASALAGAPSLLAKGPIQNDELVPVSNMRATIARRLVESKTQIPHFYVEVEIDAEPLLALRAQLNSGLEKDGVKLSVSDLILRAAAEALRVVPVVNCSWEVDAAGQAAIRHHAAAHVAFAVAIDDGLITPVIRDAHRKTVVQISIEARELAALAKAKKLKPEQFSGGTFCISNLGMLGVDRFTAIINPPNAAILAIGATVKKPVVRNDHVVVGQRLSLSLSCDHRVVDGATGARYLAALKELLEKPALLLV
jgi:pyruvate dehydrogenase E2 component (dihydrolipoamide acetyltransferase)